MCRSWKMLWRFRRTTHKTQRWPFRFSCPSFARFMFNKTVLLSKGDHATKKKNEVLVTGYQLSSLLAATSVSTTNASLNTAAHLLRLKTKTSCTTEIWQKQWHQMPLYGLVAQQGVTTGSAKEAHPRQFSNAFTKLYQQPVMTRWSQCFQADPSDNAHSAPRTLFGGGGHDSRCYNVSPIIRHLLQSQCSHSLRNNVPQEDPIIEHTGKQPTIMGQSDDHSQGMRPTWASTQVCKYN